MADSFEAIALRESKLRTQWLPMQTAVQEIVAFEKQFGEGHLLLACHAALPSLLTPELLHFMRLNFLDQQPRAPWIAEMDFLLSSLCRQIEDDLFEVEPMVREALLFQLQERYGWERLLEEASFLLEYLRKRQESRQHPGVARLHEWIAQAYLDPDKVIEELTKQLDDSLNTEQNAYQTLPKQLQIARAMELLTDPLERTTRQEKYHDLLHGARVLAYVIYENKEKLHATPLYTARQAADGQSKRLFSPAMQQWLATIAADGQSKRLFPLAMQRWLPAIAAPQVPAAIGAPAIEVTRPAQNEAEKKDTEETAENEINKRLRQAGWTVQRASNPDLNHHQSIALFDLPGLPGDYILFIDQKPVGVIHTHPIGTPLAGVEEPVSSESLTIAIATWLKRSIDYTGQRRTLPFVYDSTGIETRFTNYLEPEPRSRSVFTFHRPETLAVWLKQAPIGTPNELNDLLRSRLRHMPPLGREGLRKPQFEAIRNLERSLAANHSRALIQMATGSGKTYMAVSNIYRLIKYGNARRILFLVDRIILARQALQQFQQYVTPDTGRKFTELYNVQYLQNNRIDPTSEVCIMTIQRLCSLLTIQPFRSLPNEEALLQEEGLSEEEKSYTVRYNPALPIEYFDVIFIDECHRIIYANWHSALEYFDAFLVGLTATPDDRAIAFFNNILYKYSYDQAVDDGINVAYDIYRLQFETISQDSVSERLTDSPIDKRPHFNRDLVAVDQIRMAITAYKHALFTNLFPDRTEVPKTVIFAQDGKHAQDIVELVQEIFSKGNDFALQVTADAINTTERLIDQFRTGYNPRIIVTVNMLLGIGIEPVEVIFLMRSAKNRLQLERMISPGCLTIRDEVLRTITPDAHSKTRCVVVDPIGVTEYLRFKESPSVEEINPLFAAWLKHQQHTRQQPFTEEQIRWLERIRDRIESGQKFDVQDFNSPPFSFDGGLVAARHLFGNELTAIVQELNEILKSARQILVEMYRENIRKFGFSSRTLLYPNDYLHRAKLEQYSQILSKLVASGDSLLDIGCSYGSLVDWLRGSLAECEYHGIDIVPEFIEKARSAYSRPGVTFEVMDLEDYPAKEDWCILLDIVNNIPDPKKIIQLAWNKCIKGIIVDFNDIQKDHTPYNQFSIDGQKRFLLEQGATAVEEYSEEIYGWTILVAKK